MIVIRKNFSDQSGDEKNATAKAVGAAIGGAGMGALGGWGVAKTLEKFPPKITIVSKKSGLFNRAKKIVTPEKISNWAKNNKKCLIIPGVILGTGVALRNHFNKGKDNDLEDCGKYYDKRK